MTPFDKTVAIVATSGLATADTAERTWFRSSLSRAATRLGTSPEEASRAICWMLKLWLPCGS